jgi:hypothetical protein
VSSNLTEIVAQISVNKQNIKITTAKPRSQFSALSFLLLAFPLSTPTKVHPRANYLKSIPRAKSVSEKGRETGAAGIEEVGKEEAAWVALAIQRRMSRGRDLYADANCIC